MRTVAPRLLVLLAVFLPPSVANAGYPYFAPTYYYTPSYYPAPVYHNHYNRVVVFDFTDPYALPAAPKYVASPAADAHSSQCEENYKSLKAEMAELKAKLTAPAPAPAAAPPAPPAAPAVPPMAPVAEGQPRPAVLGGRCAVCHDGQKVSAEKGGGVMLTRGKRPVADFGAELVGKCLRYVSLGNCPKGGEKLTPAEYNAFVQELVDVSKQ